MPEQKPTNTNQIVAYFHDDSEVDHIVISTHPESCRVVLIDENGNRQLLFAGHQAPQAPNIDCHCPRCKK